MNITHHFVLSLVLIALTSCGGSDEPVAIQEQTVPEQAAPSVEPTPIAIDGPVSPANIPAGVYAVDKMHTYVTFSYLHMGYSYPLLRVSGIDGELTLDGNNMKQSNVAITIDADTIDSDMPRFNKELKSLQYFNVAKYPHITYTTHSYEPVTETTGKLTGFLTVRGKTRPVTLDVTINNAIINPYMKKPVIGFAATGTLKRSEFGIARNIPFVADEVAIDISLEFIQGSTDNSKEAANIATQTTAAAPAESLVLSAM
jgi:polyisoprenoid-binding protein YceI